MYPKVVSERLGHASVQLALDTNSHVIPALHKQAAEQVFELLLSEAGLCRQRAGTSSGSVGSNRVAERRGRNIGRVAAARKLLTIVFYGFRDGEIRCLDKTAA